MGEAVIPHRVTGKCDGWGCCEWTGNWAGFVEEAALMQRDRGSIWARRSKGEEHSRGDDSGVDKAGGES